ncbi:MAG: type II secretion system GspH family protein [Muribaculaceae bacterium]|nr:type II secretion system GspH family protein [Muribaculaceae bacterium]
MNKKAFTLAEVLITLGIIGVVAAITIPNLMTAYKAKQLRAQFLKSYSTIQQAFRQMETDDISTDPSSYKSNTFYKTFGNYLKVAVHCGIYSSNKSPVCLSENDDYKTLNGRRTSSGYFDNGQFVLMDGTNVLLENVSNTNIYVSVDLNGYKNPPNIWGYDLFTFQFLDGELRTMGSKGTTYSNLETYCNVESNDNLNGIACAHKAKTDSEYFKWVIKNVK